MVFGLVLFILIGTAFNYLYRDIITALLQGVSNILATEDTVTTAQNVLDSVEEIKTQSLISVFSIIVFITIVLGYLIARVTLTPTRDAFTSQKRFISDVAHELRTPLSVIKTNSEVALLDKHINTEMKAMIKSNIEELNRTSEIINNLLSLSSFTRLERMPFVVVDLGDIVDEAFKKLKNLAERKQLEVTIKKGDPRTVSGNGTALEQVVINLLKNAINYTPEGGCISIEVEPNHQGNIVLTVTDTGIGIAQHDLFRIFEPFYRAERSRNRQRGSSGLGLTIVNEIVKMHHGRITIKSTINKGTTAIVLLPYVKRPAVIDKENSQNEISVDFLRSNN